MFLVCFDIHTSRVELFYVICNYLRANIPFEVPFYSRLSDPNLLYVWLFCYFVLLHRRGRIFVHIPWFSARLA